MRLLQGIGFVVDRTRGSHATLVRVAPGCVRQVVTVPMHRQLALGTLRAIHRRVARFVPEEDLKPGFFTD